MATIEEVTLKISALRNKLGNLKRIKAVISGNTQVPFSVAVKVEGKEYSTDIVEMDRSYLNVLKSAYDKVRQGFTEGLDAEILDLKSQLSAQYLTLAAAHENARANFMSKASDVLKE